jgi:8-oxo-dGTP pyrophosphatase MutT (NUDIX family)
MQTIIIPGIGAYAPQGNRDRQAATRTARLIAALGDRAFGRDPTSSHVTASAFVVSTDRRQTLLMHHTKLDIRVQPGGHCDGETDVRAVALREVMEETGLSGLTAMMPEIFDIDLHVIPARPGEPAHLHHDIRFVLEASPGEILRPNAESRALDWIALDRIGDYTNNPATLVIRDRIGQLPTAAPEPDFP